jgi:hypothetical protein
MLWWLLCNEGVSKSHLIEFLTAALLEFASTVHDGDPVNDVSL